MNSNERHANSLIRRRKALDAIMVRFTSEGGFLTAISDYCDDRGSITDPAMISDLTIFFRNETPEITLAAEKLYLIAGIDIGTRFCAMHELCTRCFSDLEICDCTPEEG